MSTPTADQHTVPGVDEAKPDSIESPIEEFVVNALEGYRREASDVRKTGLNPRDTKWQENLDLYWGRYDFSKKADWQAKQTLPEVPVFVDRFAAALKGALLASPDGFFAVHDEGDQNRYIADSIKTMMNVFLSNAGRSANGTPLGFSSVFEEQMKLGCMMACSAVVTWKHDRPGGRVAIETVDPRMVWLDHTYRNLYRIRRVELDRHELAAMAKQKDSDGNAIWNLPQIDMLVSHLADVDAQTQRSRMTGTGEGMTAQSNRIPITLDEYIATVLGPDGKVMEERGLYVVANEKFLVRGPEKNPFWHGKDWLVYAPLVTTPLSVYGRSYMEDFGDVAQTFNELTNMILDAVFTSSLKAYALVPEMLLNPEQVNTGISPNKVFLLDGGYRAEDFAKALDLGTLPPESVQFWEALKNELREAANINEVGLGQFAPKGRTSATEIDATQQSSSAMVSSVAETVETRFLDPILDLVWKTGVQNIAPKDKFMAEAVGPTWEGLIANRRELASRNLTLKAHGISTLIRRGSMLKSLLTLLQIISSNEMLLQQFLQIVDMERLVELLFLLSNVPLRSIMMTDQKRLIMETLQPLMQAQQAAGPAGNGAAAGPVGGMVRSMGLMKPGMGGIGAS